MGLLRWMALAALLLSGAHAAAQGYPNRPVKVIVPFAAGGNLDIVARIVSESLAKQLGQPFVVENKPGAGGALGSDLVAKAAPDGYTLVVGTTATSILSPLLAKADYNRQSFSPVGLIGVTPLLLEVPAASPHTAFKAFIAHVRANPGKVSIGHSGNGTSNHVAILRLQEAFGLQFIIVPYKGSGPALIDLVGGQIDSMVDQVSSSMPHIKGGKLRPLATFSAERLGELSSLPTIAEEGGKAGFEVVTPSGFLAPAKTPPDVMKTLQGALAKALADGEVRTRLGAAGVVPRALTGEQFEQLLQEEEVRLVGWVKSGLLKAD